MNHHRSAMSRILSAFVITTLFHLSLLSFNIPKGDVRQVSGNGLSKHDSLDGRKILFGYANDDFLLETQVNSLLGTKLFPSRDDHISGTLFLFALFCENGKSYRADIVYHTLTDRATLFRADLLALGVTLEKEDRPILYELGLGAHLLGNLGGESLQNNFHSIFGYRKIFLNYDNSLRGGIRLSGRAEYLLRCLNDQIQVLPFSSIFYSTNSLLSSFCFGISDYARVGNFHFDGTVGYAFRYKIAPPLEHIFGSAMYYGILGETNLGTNCSLACWVTKGQFGLENEYHFGMNIGWIMGAVRPTRLKDVAFP
jgi:hypothetical protein